ncbi:MAG: class I SAM-dependent methyltransferase [Erysipelotrichaceae bacterium]|nr:class I SAM-dependent methyltransferase [Erysipelotrichaceae bacterium]
MKDRIKDSYELSKNIYDDVLTQNRWWSRLYIKIFWKGVDDNVIAERVLSYLPKDLDGRVLDVPCGTLVFTANRYRKMAKAKIVCLDYSEDMLEKAKARAGSAGLPNIEFIRGDVGALPFASESFDAVLTMNGIHAFPDKERAWKEIKRVLRPGGKLIGCYYIKGESKITDWLVSNILAKKGWFTHPFDTKNSLFERLGSDYEIKELKTDGPMVIFSVTKRKVTK